MRRLAIALVLIAASCSGGDGATTTGVPTTATTTSTIAPATTTTTPAPATTTTSTSTTSSTTTTTTVPSGFVSVAHPVFSLSYPEAWSENPEFLEFGVGFREDHTALALPATYFSVFLDEQEAGFDLDGHIQRLQDDLPFFVPDFRVIRSGEEMVDGARSLWFEYSEAFEGFPLVIREQVALRDDLLVTFRLISPVEFFEFDVVQAVMVIDSFRFS